MMMIVNSLCVTIVIQFVVWHFRPHTQRVRPGPLETVADGSKIVSGNSDGSVKIWDSETGLLLKTMENPHIETWSLTTKLNPDQDVMDFASMSQNPVMNNLNRKSTFEEGMIPCSVFLQYYSPETKELIKKFCNQNNSDST